MNKEKQKYQNKLLIETERENDLKQRELDMLDIKNNKSNITEEKIRKIKIMKLSIINLIFIKEFINITCMFDYSKYNWLWY